METVASQAVGIHNEMSGKHVVRPAPRLNFWRNRIDAPRPRQSRRGFLRWSNLFLCVRFLLCSFSSASLFSFYSDWPEMARGLNCRRFRGARWFCGPPTKRLRTQVSPNLLDRLIWPVSQRLHSHIKFKSSNSFKLVVDFFCQKMALHVRLFAAVPEWAAMFLPPHPGTFDFVYFLSLSLFKSIAALFVECRSSACNQICLFCSLATGRLFNQWLTHNHIVAGANEDLPLVRTFSFDLFPFGGCFYLASRKWYDQRSCPMHPIVQIQKLYPFLRRVHT